MQLVLLILIVPSFAFFGIEGYNRLRQESKGVAKVGDQVVQQEEFDLAQRNYGQRLQQQMGAEYDPKILDTPAAKAQVLNGLISERVALNEVSRRNLYVSNASVQQTIGEMPGIKALFGPDGKFDVERYDMMLATQNLTRDRFMADVRRSLLLKQVIDPIQGSAIVPKTLTRRLASLLRQEREVSESLIKESDFRAKVKLAADAAQKYYDAHPQEFQIPEQVQLEYVVLDNAALTSQISLPAGAVEEFYKQNKTRYEVPEQRRASHILIAAAKDASQADRDKAKAKAEDILKRVKANPADFAKLAKENSDDPGSAANGGDLDYLGKGATVPQFEKALFELKENQISDVVQSDFGYHIIRLTAIKPAVEKPLEAVRSDIESEIRKQLVGKKYAESAETFSNTVYEQPDSLKPAADKFGLKIQTASGVTRVPAQGADPKSPLGNAKLLSAVFADDVLKNKHNTAAIEIAPNQLVAARVVDYKPAVRKPLAEVSDSIQAMLADNEARKLAKQAGEARLEELRKGDSKQEFSAPVAVGRGNPANLAPEALPAIFKADVSKLPAYVGVELSSGDFAIYRIGKVVSPKVEDAQTASLEQTLAGEQGDLETNAYLGSLKKSAKVKIYPPYGDASDKLAGGSNP